MGSIKSLDRAFMILECFTESKPEWGVTELANHLGFPKSTVATILRTLRSHGYVEKDAQTNLYGLGLRLFEMGYVVRNQMKIRAHIMPALEELQKITQEIVYLTIPRGGKVLYLEAVYPSVRLVQYSTAGRLAPMHCTGVGKAMLAYMSDEEVESVISTYGLERYTPNTICDADELRVELGRIRARGYALDNEENDISIKCVAMPIRNSEGGALGSISVSGPSFRYEEDRIIDFADALQQTITQISRYTHLLPRTSASPSRKSSGV